MQEPRMLSPNPRLLLFAAALACCGQARDTILGRVSDPSEAVIAGATVTVTNQETGARTTTTTNEVGNYAVRSLAFGHYDVTCEAKGFRKYLRKANTLDLGQT